MRIFATVDWDAIRTRAKTEEWYVDIVSTMQSALDAQLAYSITVPKQAGGWIHRYVSPKNWMPLIYDSQSPHEHRSSLGDSYQDEPYDGAWRVWRHRELANLARDAGLLYRITNEARYLDASVSILRQYADIYLNFDGDWDADNWMLKGRAMNQALTEALWAYPLVLAYDLVADMMPDAESICQKLLLPIAETLTRAHDVLIKRGEMNHNYTAWLLATMGCIGFTLNDAELIDRVISGAGGFEAHLNVAILADGLEREATPYYHNFVALAYSILALSAQSKSRDLYAVQGSDGQSILTMWRAFSQLALPDGTFIEANDGSYWQDSIYDVEICEVYEVAYAQTSDPRYAWLLDKAYQRRQVSRSGWTALLYATSDLSYEKPQLESQLLKQSGFAVLHSDDLSVSAPFGAYAGGHSHLDRMSLNVYPFSLDAGSPLYSIEERKTWYKQTFSHNTVLVDGQSQNEGDAQCVEWSQHQFHLTADSLYDGIELDRKIQLTDGIADTFSVSSDDEHRYDWVFHSDSAWQIRGATPDACTGKYADDGAGQYVQFTSELRCDDPIVVETQFNDRTYTLKLSVDQPVKLFLATCPGRSQTPYIQRHVLIARVNAKSVIFQSNITVKNE